MVNRNQAEDSSGLLVRRLKLRDPEALEDLYNIYGRLLFVLIVRIVDDAGVAEDLVQETFLRAWNRADQLSDEYGSVGPWLTMIARHCALDYRKSAQGTLDSRMSAEAQFPPVACDAEVLSSERAHTLEKAFESLSPDQRLVIQLAFYEGLSHQEIAERLHRPLGTVKGWARAALSRLRGKINHQGPQFTNVLHRASA